MRVIHTVTVFGRDECNPRPRSATWGWYRLYRDAQRAVKSNHTDIFERGYYDQALIEAKPEGVASIPKKRVWFQAEFDKDGEFQKALMIKQPDWVGGSGL